MKKQYALSSKGNDLGKKYILDASVSKTESSIRSEKNCPILLTVSKK